MLDKIVYFLHVVRTGSFSDAARLYGISASAGSRWIIELEEKMGVSLLKRSTRKVVATEAGQRLYERFSDVNSEIEDIFTEIKNLGKEERGTICVAATPLYARDFLAQIVGEYLLEHPHVDFRILQTAYDVDLVEQVDFFVRANATYNGFQEKDSLLVRRSLLRYPLVACCSPDYADRYGIPKAPEDLRHHNCLFAHTLVGGNKWVFEYDGDCAAVEIARTVEVDDSEIIKSIALTGGGIAYLPIHILQNELANGRLISILSDYIDAEFEYNLYFRRRRQMPLMCTNFKDFLIKRTRELSQESPASDLQCAV
ncbi:LysR family transcriptional regulator [Pseudovibrio exalbescens]|uniref:LysR family transcriptional regulator n=1 Tax=Pseudovibrio exalbescens TaxID=197461 RepID=UPI002365727C|nr:LysR family transcriptional regulator [Pseudovibrio exalbescens]MDD7909628.1 LysR family transcriptional regulator [Pseudovibrio exalbescens]